MTYRVSADLLEHLFPADAGLDPRTLRRHTLKAGAALAGRAAITPPAAVPAIVVTVDSTFVRNSENGDRQFEVRAGNVETQTGGRQVFGAVAKALDGLTGVEQIFDWPKRVAGELRRTPPRGPACWNLDH